MLHRTLFIGPTTGKGRGVYTSEALPAGTVIEVSPVLVMEPAARQWLDKTALHDYIFEWQPEGQEQVCVAWGYLSLYNHSYTSNAEYCMDYEAPWFQEFCRAYRMDEIAAYFARDPLGGLMTVSIFREDESGAFDRKQIDRLRQLCGKTARSLYALDVSLRTLSHTGVL